MDEHIEAVQRMQDYIEANLDNNINTADLASVIYKVTPTDFNLSGLIFVFCVAFIPLRTVEDACPYKEKLNFLMRRSLLDWAFLLARVDRKDATLFFPF